jgi:hypothetical protein
MARQSRNYHEEGSKLLAYFQFEPVSHMLWHKDLLLGNDKEISKYIKVISNGQQRATEKLRFLCGP